MDETKRPSVQKLVNSIPKIFWAISGIFGLPFILTAQNFGGVPPGDSWLTKGNDHVRVIYSQDVSPAADTVLSIIGRINKYQSHPLSPLRKEVPIILRNRNLTANGFVGYIPFRSELFLYGAQNPNVLGYHDWMKLLTIHEYRHVLQYSALDRGITKLVGRVFGEAAQAGVYNLLVPSWFSEGDAVYFESELTGQGRGQLPAFSAEFRALMLANKKYSYNKYRNGSFKDLVPDHYVHGYMLTGYGYQKYGDHFWPDVLDQTSRFKGLFLPFRQAIRRHSGLKLPDFHNMMMEEFQENLYEQLDTSVLTDPFLFPESTHIKDELQILIDSAGRKYLLESSYDEIGTVYAISGRKKKKLFSLGRHFDSWLTLRGSRILFTNKGLDPRWTNREYSDVYYYDLATNQVNRVTHQKKYLSVDYQPSTQQYLAVEAGETGKTAIVTFREDDSGVDTLLLDPTTYYAYPRWIDSTAERFVFTRRQNNQMFLSLHTISSGITEDLIGPVRETIARPITTSDGVYFSSSRSGIDNIYFYDFRTKRQVPVTTDLIGAYNPCVDHLATDSKDGINLYFSATTAFGQRIRVRKLPVNALRSDAAIHVPDMSPYYFSHHSSENIAKMEVSDPATSPEKPYVPFRHLFHFHSLYLEPSLTQPTLSLLSNDYLNTTKASLYGRYLNADRSWQIGGEVTYAGWYPEIFLDINHRFNRVLNLQLEDENYALPKTETSANAGLTIPLDFSRRQFGHTLRLSGQYGWTQEHFDPEDPVLPDRIDLEPRLFQTGLLSADWSLLRLKAYRDIFPKWGITTSLLAKRSFSPGESWMLYAAQNIYVPGLFRNDGFKFRWQFQHGSSQVSNFLSYELYSIQDIPYDGRHFRTGGIFTANYLFPLAYPEISIPHVIYTRRLALNLFTEHFQSPSRQRTWSGVDLFLTANYFNLFEITTGIRVYRPWQPKTAPYSWSLVFLQDL